MRTNNTVTSALSKISFIQISILGIISLVCLLLKKYNAFSGFLVSGLTLFFYLQMLKLSGTNKFLSFFGFPVRLVIIGAFCAILVHKLHPNLIALFIGFVLSLLIYIFTMLQHAFEFKKEENH